MATELNDNLERLLQDGGLSGKIVLWGIGNRTDGLLEWLAEHEISVSYIADNFKCVYLREYKGIPVYDPERLREERDPFTVLLAIKYASAVRKQLRAYGVGNIYNLCDLRETDADEVVEIPYRFEDRRGGQPGIMLYPYGVPGIPVGQCADEDQAV